MSDEPRHVSPAPIDFELFSEDELEARINALKAEIVACETELDKKRSHRTAADALFGKN